MFRFSFTYLDQILKCGIPIAQNSPTEEAALRS